MSSSNDTNRIEAGDLLIEKNASGEIEIHNLADGESVTIGAGGLSANAIDTDELNNVSFVSTRSELITEINNGGRIAFSDDIIAEGIENEDIGGADIHIDLRGHTWKAEDGASNILFKPTNTGDVTIRNGIIDGNRIGRLANGGTARSELRPESGTGGENAFVFENASIINNAGFSITPRDFKSAHCANVSVHTNYDSGNANEAADSGGLDGFHPRDCLEISASGGVFETGDDCIAIDAADRGWTSVSVTGITANNPFTTGSAVKVLTQSTATASSCGPVELSASTGVTQDSVVQVLDQGGVGIEAVKMNVAGDVQNNGNNGIRVVGDGVSPTLHISGTIKNTLTHGIFIDDLTNFTFNGTVENVGDGDAGDRGIHCRNVTDAYLTGIVLNVTGGDAVRTDSNCNDFHGELRANDGTTLNGTNNSLTLVGS